MPGTRRERITQAARQCLSQGLMPIRRHVMSATALLLVVSAVLLVLDARLPFPSPSERILYDPSDWSMLIHSPAVSAPRPGSREDHRPGPPSEAIRPSSRRSPS